MAYTEQTWVDGEIITAEKLNHMERGISNGSPVEIYVEGTTLVINTEITDANEVSY